jgi:23S rRNA (cytidine1920-2'-O)/16S rRNA (cytidine1409-2'-O)-methyltransferase
MKQRLDKELLRRVLVASRSQAEDIIRRGYVTVKGASVTKPGFLIDEETPIEIKSRASFVSRAGEKLYSVIEPLSLDFHGKTVLDVGSSTGGFTDVALTQGAKKVIAVDVGTDQMHPLLRKDLRIDLYEKTDIRNFSTDEKIDMVVIDVSFISLREILPAVAKLVQPSTEIIAMVKPQFEAGGSGIKHKGVVKNDRMRRDILKDFEAWSQNVFKIIGKADSQIHGSKGNIERFYALKKLSKN